MKLLIQKALIVAALVTCGSQLCKDLFFTRGVTMRAFSQERFDEIAELPHKEALEVMQNHQKPIRGFSMVWENLSNPRNWRFRAGPMSCFFILTFSGCLWMGRSVLNKEDN
jgi:hypothetical protein